MSRPESIRSSMEDQETFFQERMCNLSPLGELFLDRSRVDYQRAELNFLPISLPEDVRHSIDNGLNGNGTRDEVLLAAFTLLLGRIFEKESFDIGLVGDLEEKDLTNKGELSTSEYPLPIFLSATHSFLQFLVEFRINLNFSYQHKHDWRNQISTDSLRAIASNGNRPFFPIICSFSSSNTLPHEVSHRQLLLQIGKDNCYLGYHPGLYSATTIERLKEYFETLLTAIVADPKETLWALPLLSSVEQEHLLIQFSKGSAAKILEQSVAELFEAQVKETAQAVALVCQEQPLTYQTLNTYANQLAHYLQGLGVGPGTLVGILTERCQEMIIGILAVIKTGGAYLPLDPNYPKDRIAFMLQDAKVSILLTQSPLLSQVAELREKTICLDSDWSTIAQQSQEDSKHRLDGKSLAYLIYTSGSTGQPKGVMITQGNLSHYVQTLPHHLGITKEDTYLHTASFSFSSSVRQLFLPLCLGSKVVMASNEQIRDPLALFQLIKDKGVTVIDIVPSYWHSCIQALLSLEEGTRKELLNNQLRLIVTASEPLTFDIVEDWFNKIGHPVEHINMYGQTETTGIVSVYKNRNREDFATRIFPIGKPIANTQIYLLDRHQRPVPIGVVGEIYIGGYGIGRGYLNLPDLTAEKFIVDPFTEDIDSYLYRTGDLGRYLSDGNIEFLGRRDEQVKIRGYRVELGEIESVLKCHLDVQEIAVVVCEDDNGNKRLMAYTILVSGSQITSDQLRDFASMRLPDYMIPQRFHFLDTFPRTPNGKIDRHALANVEKLTAEVQDAENSKTISGDTLEEVIANFWAESLGLEKVDPEADFFELGGDSMQAIQLMSQLQDIFPTEVHLLAFFFESPTVASLALAIESELGPENVENILQTLKSAD